MVTKGKDQGNFAIARGNCACVCVCVEKFARAVAPASCVNSPLLSSTRKISSELVPLGGRGSAL